MLRRWRMLLAALGLNRLGRVVFSAVAALGVVVVVGDDVIPRHGAEARMGPNAAAIAGVLTVALLLAVVAADLVIRLAWRGIRSLAAQ